MNLQFDEKVATPLCAIMGKHNSDKGNVNIAYSHHNYTTFYHHIFKNMRDKSLRVFELGLGTNNINIPSNMGSNGTPGASLRGWREFFFNSDIYGADIDKEILFTEDRIKTFFCDQTNPVIIHDMWENPELKDKFDIIVEDGLHTFSANVCFFENSVQKIKDGGYYIIEDVLANEFNLFLDKIKEWERRYTDFTFLLLRINSIVNPWDNNLIVIQKRAKQVEVDDILFVTAYKDIGRGDWNMYRRSNEEYLYYFLNLVNNIKYKLIVYLEDDIKSKLSGHKFNDNIIFVNYNSVNTFLNNHLEKEIMITQSDIYKEKIPPRKTTDPAMICAHYDLVNHSKINFVRDAKQRYPDYQFYSWIDFGYVRKLNSVPTNINTNTLPHKVIYHCLIKPTDKIDVNIMLTNYDVYITGSSYIVHTSLVETYEKIYEDKLIEWEDNYIVDDDQSLILQLYYDKPDMFHLIQGNEWFSLYNILPK